MNFLSVWAFLTAGTLKRVGSLPAETLSALYLNKNICYEPLGAIEWREGDNNLSKNSYKPSIDL